MVDRLNKFKSSIEKALTSSLTDIPVGTGRFLTLTGVSLDDPDRSLSAELKTKLAGQTHGTAVKGSFVLKDTINNTEEKVTKRLFKLPIRTNRGTYIWNGNEIILKNQYRRKPGVYVSQDTSGTYGAAFNMALGTSQFDQKVGVEIDPESGKLLFKVKDSKYSLYALMKAFDISDSDIKTAMGDKVFRINYTESVDKEINKIAKRLTKSSFNSTSDAVKAIKEKFEGISFSGGSNEITLGKGHETVTKSFWLDVTKKLRKTATGQLKPDDVNASYFREYLEPEDNIIESIKASSSKFVTRVRRRGSKRDLKGILSDSKFEKPVYDLFSNSSLKDYQDQTNPTDWLSGEDSLTVFGPGGISHSRAISDSMRSLQPTLHGLADPLATPESSEKVGVVLHRAVGSVIKNREPHIKVQTKAGKATSISSYEFSKNVVGIGDSSSKGTIGGFVNGESKRIQASSAKYFIKAEDLFSTVTNLIPMLGATYGVRANVGAKQLGQALPLKFREAPLVESEFSAQQEGKALKNFPSMDMQGNVIAINSGKVKALRGNKITVEESNGGTRVYEYPDNFPLNTESFMQATPRVKVGDSFKKNEILADSVFSQEGKLALGTNLKTGFLAYKGYNFEDGFVISEGASKKLTSLHLLKYEVSSSKDIIVGKQSYLSVFPNAAMKIDLSKYSDNGIIIKGSQVENGTPLILAYEKRELTPSQAVIASLNKKVANLLAPRDISVLYEKDFPGVVSDVYSDNKYSRVFVKTEEPAIEGDKIATRYGGKGIITKILPDAQMPLNEEQEPLEVLFNPHGLPSRMNPSQLVESTLGKIAKKEGKFYTLPQFGDEGFIDLAKKEVSRSGISDEETVTDPETGKKMNKVHVGLMHFNKLKHSVRKKLKAGSTGFYDVANEQPRKTEDSSVRAIDSLSFYSLLAAGARKNLADMSNIKANRNDEFWRAFVTGTPLPPPRTPAIRDNFLASLQALGLNTHKTKDTLTVSPSTNEDILNNSNGEIKEAKFLRSRDMKPEKGGFYDPLITGGDSGDKWSHIKLGASIPNPIFESAITKILGLTTKNFNNIIKGTTRVNSKGEIDDKGKLFGGKAIASMLDSIDIDSRILSLRKEGKDQAKEKDWTGLNNTNTKLRFLTNIKTLGKKPSDLYVLDVFPVLPPKFRQMTVLPNGTVQNPALNELYQSLKLESDGIGTLKNIGFDDEEMLGDRVFQMYQHTGAILGTADPVSFQLKQRAKDKGILRQMSPKEGAKFGTIQSKMARKTQDISGGSTITVDPELPLDHVGVPEEMAYKIMKPFIMKKLVGLGYTPIKAMESIKDKSDIARLKLDEVMGERPVLVNRHPSLHKFNFMSQWGHVIPGKSIKLNPLVIHGFNADFDGDSMIGDIWLSAPGEYNVDCGDSMVKTQLCVTTDISEVPHGELIEQRANKYIYDVPPGVTVPAISPEGKIELKAVTKFHKHKSCEEWRVTFADKTSLNVSGNHSLVCFNPEKCEVEKTLPVEAEYMCVPRLFDYEYTNPNPFEGVEKFSGYDKLTMISCLGFFVGSMRKNRGKVGGFFFGRTSFMGDRVDMLNDYVEAYIDEENRFMSQFVINWVNENAYLIDEVRLPSFLVGISKKEREAFVAGILESSINTKRPGLIIRASSNQSFLKDISKILQSVGVDCSIVPIKYKKDTYYELEIKQPDVRDFYLKNAHFFSTPARLYLEDSKILHSHSRVHDFVPVPTYISMLILETIRFRVDAKTKNNKLRYAYNIQSYGEWVNLGYEPWSRSTLEYFLSFMTREEMSVIPVNFIKLVTNPAIRWGLITNTRRTGRVIDMYDITVEDYKNFAADKGYFVWDTMNMHVPVTEEARLEAARKLMPSQSLFGPDRNILPMPSNEALLGLYILSKKGKRLSNSYLTLSKAESAFIQNEIEVSSIIKIAGKVTTLGMELIKQVVPNKYHSEIEGKIIDKSAIQDLIKRVYSDDPKKAGTLLSELKDLGNKYVYLTGFSISLKDLDAPSNMRQNFDSIVNTYGKDSKLADNFDSSLNRFQTKYKSFFDDNRIYDMKRSGAKGKWSNVSQMLLSPGYMEGPFGQGVQDQAVQTGYAQGMQSSDYLNTLFASRSGIVAKARGTAKGGELAKDEVHASMELVVTEKDCGTSNGVSMDRGDRFLIGRFLPGKDSPIDETYLKTHKAKNFVVRSPLTCESVKGVCIKCYGLNDQLRIPSIGDHVGVEAAQVTSEKITQGLLRSFHSGKGASSGGSMSLEKQVSNLFGKIPGTFSGEAPVVTDTGFVDTVDKSPAGGWDIFVEGKKYHATDSVDPIVKKGDRVEAGAALTTGMKHPKKVMEVEGLLGVRKYLTNSMRDLYASTGVDLNPIHFEVLSRSLTEHGRVTDPGTSEYETGDMENISVLDRMNKTGLGVKYEPQLAGANRIPLLRNDFLAQSSRREARTAIPNAAIKGQTTNIHGINPINSWILGDFRYTPGKSGEF